jgi:Zn-dependent peptidase ImmA (M78 family)
VTLPRGFKAHAEREAARVRREMELRPTDPLNAISLAEHIGARVVSAEKLVPLKNLEELERLQAFAFSAATFEVGDKKIIVTNPLRSPGRLASDVAHEVSHLMLQHDLTEVREIDGLPFRTCKPDEEEQATAFGGTLLLPRSLLSQAALRGEDPAAIAGRCGVTLEMARFRFNTTGVARQAALRSR